MYYETVSVENMFDMFLDRTTGESYRDNRLITEETEGGDVALVAYGWLKLAVYDESRNAVTVFTGHKALESKTISRWLNQVVSRAHSRGRDAILSGESPVVNTPNDTTDYIGNYIGSFSNLSSVEKNAYDSVRESLKHVA